MPLINYLCECKNSKSKFYRKSIEAPKHIVCDLCGKDMKRRLSAPTCDSKVVIDNGYMARSIEVNPDIVAINEERSKKDYSEE